MTVHDRWFLTPAETVTEGEIDTEITRPKYSGHDDVAGFAGNTTTPDVVSTHYPALTQTFPGVDEWYIVRFYGQDDPGWQALNQIHGYQDTRTLVEYAADVAPVLGDVFPGLDRGAPDWADAFGVEF